MDKSLKQIMVVDDNLKNLQVTAKVLKDKGYLISLAMDGPSALTLINNQMPDLILLDVMMPDMDGLEVCRIIKQDKKLREIPIVFLTAKNETVDLVEGFKAGGVDYITKPFNQDELLVRINTHLELASSRKKIIELNQNRDKLYSIIAHDIRSPLNNILSTIQLLARGVVDPSSIFFKDLMIDLEKATNETSNLLNNLLDWTRVQSSSITMNPKINNIHSLILECVQLYKFCADAKNIQVEINVPIDSEAFFDAVSIHTVFRNLISNAIKFTPEHGIITITSEVKEKTLVIHFKDNGVGMSEETIRKIFNNKQHHTSLGTKNEKGTGLGLFVIKEFVESNNGVLDVNSTENIGTTFSISIPITSS